MPQEQIGTDGKSNSRITELVTIRKQLFNGTSWDRERAVTEETIFAAQIFTEDTQSADVINYNHRGIIMYWDITAVSGTSPTCALRLQMKDPITDAVFTVSSSASRTAAGDYLYQHGAGVDGGLGGGGQLGAQQDIVNSLLPRTFQIKVDVGGTTPSFTFSLGASFCL